MRNTLAYVALLLLLDVVLAGRKSRHSDDLHFEHLLTKEANQTQLCRECEEAVAAYHAKGYDYVYNELGILCKKGYSPYNEAQCIDSLEMYKEEGKLIIENLNDTPASQACKFLMGCGVYTHRIYKWEFPLETSSYRHNTEVTYDPPLEGFNVLHLTDTHISTQYVEGATWDCQEELCCSDRQENSTDRNFAAGPYGDIRGKSYCDLPIKTLRSLLKNTQIRQFDYVYLTGDFIPHTTFGYTFERVIHEIRAQTNIISSSLGGKKIYPAIGNHDDYPAFLFPTHKMEAGKFCADKLYHALWRLWRGTWIPNECKQTFLRGGFYTTLARPGLRIVSLNTIYCYNLNWWLVVNPKDPEEQLEWLVQVLKNAADAGEYVHILGHVPPGTTDCKVEWATAYQKIVSKFRDTITGQFFGHIHWDQFFVDYEFDSSYEVPTGVQFAGPVATTYMTGHPSYRIMHFNGTSHLLDMDTYFLNVTEANENYWASLSGRTLPSSEKTDNPVWKLAYSYKEEYNMVDLSPSSFHKLIQRMKTETPLLTKYYRLMFQHRESEENISCGNGTCIANFYFKVGSTHKILCEMYSTGSRQQEECFDEYSEA